MSNPRFDPTHPKAMDDSDDTDGHFMAADTVPEELHQPADNAADDATNDATDDTEDTEGHVRVAFGSEGFRQDLATPDGDDTEGHVRASYGPEGFKSLEPEGFRAAFAVEDEEDTEGHVIRTRPAPEGSRPMPDGEGIQPHRDDRIG